MPFLSLLTYTVSPHTHTWDLTPSSRLLGLKASTCQGAVQGPWGLGHHRAGSKTSEPRPCPSGVPGRVPHPFQLEGHFLVVTTGWSGGHRSQWEIRS